MTFAPVGAKCSPALVLRSSGARCFFRIAKAINTLLLRSKSSVSSMLMPLKRFLFFNPEDVDYESTTPANPRSKPLKNGCEIYAQ
jgi:hypothetical protein